MAMLPVGVLWKSATDAKSSATGEINLPQGVKLTLQDGQRLVMMRNPHKASDGDNLPHWYIYLADNEIAPAEADAKS